MRRGEEPTTALSTGAGAAVTLGASRQLGALALTSKLGALALTSKLGALVLTSKLGPLVC